MNLHLQCGGDWLRMVVADLLVVRVCWEVGIVDLRGGNGVRLVVICVVL